MVVAEDPTIINSGAGKSATMRKVRELCAKVQARIVFMVSDTFMAKYTAKDGDDMKIVNLIREIGAEEAEKRGLVTRREAIIVQISTPLSAARLIQFYKRQGDAIIWEERETMGPHDVLQEEGRLTGFFDHLKPGGIV